MTKQHTRRRFLAIAASAGAAASLPPLAWAVPNVPVSDWRGTALGAPASMTLVHPDRDLARRTISACVDEIARLESVFSLYLSDSALVKLNTDGFLKHPPIELLEVLSFSMSLAERSSGYFDPTIQPLYITLAKHFSSENANPQGPSQSDIARALKLVDYNKVFFDSTGIGFRQEGMALTLNGVAQGYITDKVSSLLSNAGFTDILIDIGEVRASGVRADGSSWVASVAYPQQPEKSLITIPLGSGPQKHTALATSSGAGSTFGASGKFHHLLNPISGQSAHNFKLVSVAASKAMVADGLSTALSVVGPAMVNSLVSAWPKTQAWLVKSDGNISTVQA